LYEKAIAMGDVKAAFNLAFLYQKGIEGQLKPHASKAIEFYEKAIEMGNTKAIHNLGSTYKNGIKGQLKPNASKAIQLYEKAIEIGHAFSAFNLANLYKHGIKGQVRPQLSKAIELYEKAIEMGEADAALNLANLYKNGIKGQLQRNVSKAIQLYGKAIERGNTNAAFKLANLYKEGFENQLSPSKQLTFKAYHDGYLATKNAELFEYHLKKFLIKTSPIKMSQSDLEESKQGLSIFIKNIETLVGLVLLKQEENNPSSQAVHFKDSYILPELYPCYTALLAYVENVLKITKFLLKPAFLVDCIKVKTKEGKKKKYIDHSDHLHEYVIWRHPYLCLGEANVKAAEILIDLFENESILRQNVSNIKKVLYQRFYTELGKRLQEQALKKLPTDYSGTVEEFIAARTQETLEMLDGVQNISAQLKELVVATPPLRNKNCEQEYPFFFKD
jgi:hypothetical protein